MSELRRDPIVGRWVIIAPERGLRPHFAKVEARKDSEIENCPFCEGNESKTPPEIIAYGAPGREPNTPGWDVRVIPNKFPALRVEAGIERLGFGLLDKVSGTGAHEVVVETPRHDITLGELSEDNITLVLRAWKERIIDLDKDDRLRYALVFKNKGIEAGASLPHSHSQIIATPITPMVVKEELNASKEYYCEKERCIFCDYIYQELRDKKRVIYQDEHYVVLSAYAARFPYEVWILPKEHLADFQLVSDEQLYILAGLLKNLLGGYKEILGDPPYNLLLHNAPLRTPRPGYWLTVEEDYHWHFEILPRLTRVAGFEWGTGFYINPVTPEHACKVLKKVFK